MPVSNRAERFRCERQLTSLESKIEHSKLIKIIFVKSRVLHVRMINRPLLTEDMNDLDWIALLPKQVAQIIVRADLFARRLTQSSGTDRACGPFPDECCFQVIYFVCNISFVAAAD